ncbi:hypothetical protein [Oscillatoria acuminata]|uniref:hypothetical protein n=1 Tax=Oscillatoria acuminata TaxID=118323 RepID=UPI0018DB6FB5|nr:hypothetical protein [Oscillatoria acuminata]
MRILAGKVKVATPTDQLTSTEPPPYELLKLAHALFLKLAAEGLDKAELRGFIKRRYGKPTVIRNDPPRVGGFAPAVKAVWSGYLFSGNRRVRPTDPDPARPRRILLRGCHPRCEAQPKSLSTTQIRRKPLRLTA